MTTTTERVVGGGGLVNVMATAMTTPATVVNTVPSIEHPRTETSDPTPLQ